MFEIGISELALIGVVALIVLGPERLPKAARMAGALLRRVRGSWTTLRAELEREIAADELRKSFRDVSAAVHDANPVNAVRDAVDDVAAGVRQNVDEVRHSVDPQEPRP